MSSTHPIRALCATVLLALAACGGGGGGGGDPGGTTTTSTDTSATSGPSASTLTVAQMVPATTMDWTTQSSDVMTLSIVGPDGRPAAGAGVRIFTLSRTSLQDGSALDAPVPVSLLDSAVSDGSGQVSLSLQWPAHLSEVLVVATLGDAQAQQVVALGGVGGAAAALSLAR